ncbi:hypothetical protein GCM10020358_81130 [Amorphoplanes nipponensis]|uniref:Uncharacterized protein n=1 Tax=Actinoplanes nipponensis TaxID=135950 RepID=A0A919JJ19_9ACTN|nr:hypothetical protein [Actinoplanes nipponensis]GIE47694.1 hypothetical protein Ani05nite_12280 [Actinoplanes nipponensis]
MRWFPLGPGRRRADPDPARQQALLEDIRRRYGAHVRVPFPEQAAAVVPALDGDDGLAVAATVLREFADEAHAELLAQAGELYRRTGHGVAVDRRNYRPLWQAAGPELRWPLFALPGRLHPYVQVAAAATVLGDQARRYVRVADPQPPLAHLFEILDLTVAGWEYGRVPVDADAAALAGRLIATARELRAAMPEPPPLPPPVRELMRRNHTVDVREPGGHRVVGGFNPGREMRQSLLA